MRRSLIAAVITLLLAPLVLAEHYWLPLGVTGLVKADLALELRECTGPVDALADCPTISDAAVTVTEAATGHYLVAPLPDAVAGSLTSYVLLGTADSVPFQYVWPRGTITPQSTSSVVSYSIPAITILAAGDTLPAVDVTVSGLSSDPTGATITFNLWAINGTLILDDVPATLVDSTAQVGGTWRATFRHNWTELETSGLATTKTENYYGRFTVTFAAGGVMTIPPAPNSLQVRVHP